MPTFYSSVPGRPRKARDKAAITLPTVRSLSTPIHDATPEYALRRKATTKRGTTASSQQYETKVESASSHRRIEAAPRRTARSWQAK